MATNVHTSNIRVRCLFKSSTKDQLAKLFSDAILRGNAIHHDLFKDIYLTRNTNLTVPEAMEAGKSSLNNMTEWVRFKPFQYVRFKLSTCFIHIIGLYTIVIQFFVIFHRRVLFILTI